VARQGHFSEKPSILRAAAREMGASLGFGTEGSADLPPMMVLPRSHEGCGASDRARAGSFIGTPMAGEFDWSGQILFFCVTPLSLLVPFRGREPPGFHRSEYKALPCTSATTETRKIVSVSMPVLNSIFAM